MEYNKKIFWISSYPKSGNTWLRLILCGLFYTKDGILDDFKILKKIPKFDIIENFNFIKDFSKKDFDLIFNKNEYDDESVITYSKYWIEAQKRKDIISGNFSFFKTHNARAKINSNFYTNEETTLGFIYISRDPRDIVISYANHMQSDLNFVVDYLVDGQIMGRDKTRLFMPEITLNWGDNYLSWKKFSDVPSLFLKYENLLYDPDKEISKISDFFIKKFNIFIDNEKEKIKNIIKTTNFKNLKKKEKEKGFHENKKSPSFFRTGKKQQWKNRLSNSQIKKINDKFKDIMKDLKYL